MGKKYYYKVLDNNLKELITDFKIGEVIEKANGEFYFCDRLEDTIWESEKQTDRHVLVEATSEVRVEDYYNLANQIRVVKEITRDEIEEYITEFNSPPAEKFLATYSTNVERLTELAKHEDKWIKVAVAENVNTPTHLLEDLYKDDYWFVKLAVTKNPNTSIKILKEASKESHYYVRDSAKEMLAKRKER